MPTRIGMACVLALGVGLMGCGDSKNEGGSAAGNPLNAFGSGPKDKPTGEAAGGDVKSAQPATAGTTADGKPAVSASDVLATGGTIGKFGALAKRVCACTDKKCSDTAMHEYEQLAGKLGSLKLSADDATKLKATSAQITQCAAKFASADSHDGRTDQPAAAVGDVAKFADTLGKHSALADSVCACKDKACADAVNKQLIDLLNQTSTMKFTPDDQQKIKIAGEKFNGCYLNLVVAGLAAAPAATGTAAKKTGTLGLAGGVKMPPPAGKAPSPAAKPVPRSTQPGRRGHEQCPPGKYMWGGKCDGPDYFKDVAKRRSRIYFSRGKDCPPGMAHRSGTYCYTCPSGKYWERGGSCTRSCSGGKNRAERKCSVKVAGRRGHEKCPPGKYMWGGSCDGPTYFKGVASRRSRIYFASGKDCPPHIEHRSSTYCYVCPFGKYWNKGRCVTRCSGGIDYAKRQCQTSTAGRKGHESCAAGTYMYAGKCTPTNYFTKLALRRSRMFFGSSKSCPPGFRHRSGSHCYVCPFGKYWNNGLCTSRCLAGTDTTERKCATGGSSVTRRPVASGGPGRRGHGACPAGKYMYAGQCTGADYFHRLASRKSKMFFGRSKSCPPGFPYRQGSDCYVCKPGQYWSNGGCVGRCVGGTDIANRKCR